MAGAADPLPRTVTAPLGEDLPANGPRTDYLRAELRDGRAFASTIQDSSMLATLARAGCLIHRAPGAPAAHIGERVEILPLACKRHEQYVNVPCLFLWRTGNAYRND